MDNLALPLFILIALLIILTFAYLIKLARQANPTRHLEAENLGFREQNPPDPDFAARILNLHSNRTTQSLLIRQTFIKPYGDTTFYLFDLVDTGDGEPSTMLDGAFAVVSPSLELPTFGLFPRVPGESLLAQAANQLIARLLEDQAQIVNFDDRLDFDQRYLVIADDPQAIRALLDDYLQDRLSTLEMLQIQAGGDMLTVGKVSHALRKPDEPRDLETLYRQTLTVFDLLRHNRGKE